MCTETRWSRLLRQKNSDMSPSGCRSTTSATTTTCPAVMPMLGAIAARTSTIRIGSYLALAPLYHPIRLAEDSAVVDVLSNGRLELGLGSGYVKSEFVSLGADFARRGTTTGETAAILLQAWSEDPVSFRGSNYSFEGVTVAPKPIQRPVPIYLGGVSRPVLERVARLGLMGVAGFPPAEDMEYFHEQLRTHGRDARAIDYLGYVHLWVDRDHERARRIAAPFEEWVLGRYRQWSTDAGRDKLYEGDLNDHIIMGDPNYCVERLSSVVEKYADYPRRRLILIPPLLGLDHVESMRMIETFALDVAPHM